MVFIKYFHVVRKHCQLQQCFLLCALTVLHPRKSMSQL